MAATQKNLVESKSKIHPQPNMGAASSGLGASPSVLMPASTTVNTAEKKGRSSIFSEDLIQVDTPNDHTLSAPHATRLPVAATKATIIPAHPTTKSSPSQERKAGIASAKRYINIPEGKIGRLEKRSDEGDLRLYIKDFNSSTIIIFISDQRISLLHFDSIFSGIPSAIKKDHILAEMEWVSGGDDCDKIIVQPPLGNLYPSAFTALDPSLTRQFTQRSTSSQIYALSVGWKGEEEWEIRPGEVSEVERHPLENFLLRFPKHNMRSIVPRETPSLNPIIFTGSGWQTNYPELDTRNLSEKAKAFLSSAKKEQKAETDLAAVSTVEVPAEVLPASPWAELREVLVKKQQCKGKNNRGKAKAKAKAKLAKVIPRLTFDKSAIVAARFSLEDALARVKQLEESYQEAANLPLLKNQLEEALIASGARSATNLESSSALLEAIATDSSSQADGKEEKNEIEEVKSLSTPSAHAHDSKYGFFGKREDKSVPSPTSTQKKDLPIPKSAVALDADYQFTSITIQASDSHKKSATVFTFFGADGSPTSSIDKAVELMQEDEFAAIAAFLEIIGNTSESELSFVMAAYHLGLCYRVAGNVQDAKKYIDQAIQLLEREDLAYSRFATPDARQQFLSVCYIERSKTFKLLGNEAEEESALHKAIAVYKENHMAYNALGWLRQCQGDLAGALNYYEQAISYNAQYPTAYCNLGLLLSRVGEHTEALEYYDKAIEMAPNVPLYYTNRGLTKQALGLFQEAQKDFEKAIELDSDYVSAHVQLALNDLQRGYPRKAILSLQHQLALDPTGLEILANLPSAYLMNGDGQEAISAASRLLHIYPDNLVGWTNLVSAYILVGKYESALAAWENLMQYSEGIADKNLCINKYSLLAQILTRFKYYGPAIKAYEAVLTYHDTEDTKANIYFNLANLYFDDRNYAKALEYYKKAYAILKNPIVEQYIKEAQEGMDDPDIFLPESRGLRYGPIFSKLPDARKTAFEEKLRVNRPGASARENVYYEDGLPFHQLVIHDEMPIAKSAKIRKLSFNATDGLWYQCRYPARGLKRANSDTLYNFIVTKNERDEVEIIYGRIGHFHLSKDREVIFAGEIWFKNGQIGMWNNASGHFKPDAILAPQVAALCKLPLDKFESLDKLKDRLSASYKKFQNLRLMAADAPEKMGDQRILRSMRGHYMVNKH
jgi:tetratricopeptide (TPR) repeat protein